MTTNRKPGHGRIPNHKVKPYVVLQYLMKESDENNTKTAHDIIDFLYGHGIFAERRSIYRDIEEINKIALMLDEDCEIEEAEEMLSYDDTDDLK